MNNKEIDRKVGEIITKYLIENDMKITTLSVMCGKSKYWLTSALQMKSKGYKDRYLLAVSASEVIPELANLANQYRNRKKPGPDCGYSLPSQRQFPVELSAWKHPQPFCQWIMA